MRNLNAVVFVTNRNGQWKREKVVLTMEMTIGVFTLYLVGIGSAIFCFVIELVVGKAYSRDLISSVYSRMSQRILWRIR